MKPFKFLDGISEFSSSLAVAVTGLVAFVSTTFAQGPGAAGELAKPALEKFRQSAAVFIANQGQWPDASIRFALSSPGANAGVDVGGVRFQVFQPPAHTVASPEAAVHAKAHRLSREPRATAPQAMKEFSAVFVGSRAVAPAGEGDSGPIFNYHRGDPAQWRENVPSWNSVVYRGLYEGIDLRLTGRRSGIKYEFVVAPGADWRQVQIRCQGLERLRLRADGGLELNVSEGWAPLVDDAPVIYQETNGQRVNVPGRFVLVDDLTYGFVITGRYDASQPLVIDPELAWSTYLGAGNDDYGKGIAVDSAGNVLVTGRTYSAGWVSGGWDTTLDDTSDAFVVKLSPAGAHLWSTYLGGTDGDFGWGIAVDGANNVLVTGTTFSASWVSGGWDTDLDDAPDAFVVKLSSAGAHLWSTFVGGDDWDYGEGIAVDSANNVLVTGTTESVGWVSGGFDTSLGGGEDGFVVKLSPVGARLWSTYIGGSQNDFAYGIAVDSANNVLVTGLTCSFDWVSGGWDTTLDFIPDAFVVKLSPIGAHLWSTYVGGYDYDCGIGIAVDSADNVLVTGVTASDGWVSGGFDTSLGISHDAFVVKLSPAGAHLWSSYLGGYGYDCGNGIAVDRANNVVVVGETSASGWVSGGYDVIYNGLRDAFVAHITPWVDIGLRVYDGTQTLRIACEAPGPGGTLSSPLRIAKNGTTYGIVLVDPATATASKMRVQTASGIKVWQKLP